MLQERDIPSGLRLITAIACILLLVLPGVVCAKNLDTTVLSPDVTTSVSSNVTTSIVPNVTTVIELNVTTSIVAEATTDILPNVTSQPATPVPTILEVHENTTVTVNPPPLLIFDTPVIQNLTVTIYGIADPGSANVTIDSLLWEWGDSQTPEYHEFPYSHVYSSPGNYILMITARQSDGQQVTGRTRISVGQPAIPETLPTTLNTPVPGGSVVVTGPPVLTLLEPVIDRMNVTLNGNLYTPFPGVAIELVSIDWNDGNITKSDDLPVTHQYSRNGIFTITVTGYQTDGQSTTKRITLALNDAVPAVTTPVPSGPPPNEPPIYLIIIITAIIVLAIVIVGQWIIRQKNGSPPGPDIPKVVSVRAGPLPGNLPSQTELATICSGTDVTPEVLDSVIQVAVEIAREGREGQSIGTSFVVGDSENVLNHSRQFVLNPFHGHEEAERQITDIGIRGNIKEFAQLDGAFLITGKGVVEAAGRCITVDMSRVNLPGGLGSRHSSTAGITQVTRSIGVVVSQSGGQISIFSDGKIVYTINP